jgi:Tol biopolymer transport system component
MIRGVLSSRVAAVRAVVLAFVASMVVIVGAVGTKPAEAAFAGKNGRIAFMSNRDGDFEVFVMGVNGSNQTSRTNNEVLDEAPAFSPDGKRIAFHSQRVENLEVFAINANGSGIKNLTRSPARDGIVDWQANTAPTVTSLQPAPGSTTRDKTPTIRAVVKDQQTNLTKANITLSTDGKAIANTRFSYDPSTDKLAFTPERELPAGRHNVKVVARDDVLLAGQRTLSFKVATS